MNSEHYQDLSGTGMTFELRPIFGKRGDHHDIVGGILLIDGTEQERFAINDKGLWLDSFGNECSPDNFAAYISQHVNEIRSKRRAGEKGKE